MRADWPISAAFCFLSSSFSFLSLKDCQILGRSSSYKPHDLVENCATAAAVRNSWYGFLGTDIICSMVHDFERTQPLASITHTVLFVGER